MNKNYTEEDDEPIETVEHEVYEDKLGPIVKILVPLMIFGIAILLWVLLDKPPAS